METRTLTTKKGKVVETPYPDGHARELLAEYIEAGKIRGKFPNDLANRAKLTPDMMTWVHALVLEAEAEKPEAPKGAGGFEGIIALMDKAHDAGLKWPKLTALLHNDTLPVKLARAGDRSKKPGTINVTDGGRYPDNIWYGRIERDGTYVPGRGANERDADKVIEFLGELAADPSAAAGIRGRMMGACCFCSKELTDGRSVAVGYGPVCAEHFGLEWGEKRVTVKEIAESLEEHAGEPEWHTNSASYSEEEVEAAAYRGGEDYRYDDRG
jgi:hypothetical protein